MNLSEALNQAKGMVITDLTVKITKAFKLQEGETWARIDLRAEDTTANDVVVKWWSPTMMDATPLVGQTVTICARPNAKSQWVGAKTEVWEKNDGSVQAQVNVDGDHLSLFGAPGPVTEPDIQVNADVAPPAGWDAPVAQPQTIEPPKMAAPVGGARDLCQLIADLQGEIAKKLIGSITDYEREPDWEVAFKEAGTSARTLFIELAKTGKLGEAAAEFSIPF